MLISATTDVDRNRILDEIEEENEELQRLNKRIKKEADKLYLE